MVITSKSRHCIQPKHPRTCFVVCRIFYCLKLGIGFSSKELALVFDVKKTIGFVTIVIFRKRLEQENGEKYILEIFVLNRGNRRGHTFHLTMSSGGKNGIVSFLFFLLFFSPPPSAAQLTDSNIGHESYARFTPTMAMIIAGLVVALFFMGFFSIYLRNCSRSGGNGSSVRPVNVGAWRGRRDEMRGLEASVIETFPTMVYSEVKVHKIGKGALECAVCLNEFEDDETLRLIPKCDHVFHAECIDPWLASHVTCPVCRANLATQPGDPVSQLIELDNTVIELNFEAQNNDNDLEITELGDPVSQPIELDNTVIELDLEAQNNDNNLEIREERGENQNINTITSDVEAQVSLEGLFHESTKNGAD
ncbi:hypothetical protein V6Z11_A08G244800 [Gossypium hirsutum]